MKSGPRHLRDIGHWFERSQALLSAWVSIAGAEAECARFLPSGHPVRLTLDYNSPLWRALLRRPMELVVSRDGQGDEVLPLELGDAGEWRQAAFQTQGGALRATVRDCVSGKCVISRSWTVITPAKVVEALQITHEALAITAPDLPGLHLVTPVLPEVPLPLADAMQYSLTLACSQDTELIALLLNTSAYECAVELVSVCGDKAPIELHRGHLALSDSAQAQVAFRLPVSAAAPGLGAWDVVTRVGGRTIATRRIEWLTSEAYTRKCLDRASANLKPVRITFIAGLDEGPRGRVSQPLATSDLTPLPQEGLKELILDAVLQPTAELGLGISRLTFQGRLRARNGEGGRVLGDIAVSGECRFGSHFRIVGTAQVQTWQWQDAGGPDGAKLELEIEGRIVATRTIRVASRQQLIRSTLDSLIGQAQWDIEWLLCRDGQPPRPLPPALLSTSTDLRARIRCTLPPATVPKWLQPHLRVRCLCAAGEVAGGSPVPLASVDTQIMFEIDAKPVQREYLLPVLRLRGQLRAGQLGLLVAVGEEHWQKTLRVHEVNSVRANALAALARLPAQLGLDVLTAQHGLIECSVMAFNDRVARLRLQADLKGIWPEDLVDQSINCPLEIRFAPTAPGVTGMSWQASVELKAGRLDLTFPWFNITEQQCQGRSGAWRALVRADGVEIASLQASLVDLPMLQNSITIQDLTLRSRVGGRPLARGAPIDPTAAPCVVPELTLACNHRYQRPFTVPVTFAWTGAGRQIFSNTFSASVPDPAKMAQGRHQLPVFHWPRNRALRSPTYVCHIFVGVPGRTAARASFSFHVAAGRFPVNADGTLRPDAGRGMDIDHEFARILEQVRG